MIELLIQIKMKKALFILSVFCSLTLSAQNYKHVKPLEIEAFIGPVYNLQLEYRGRSINAITVGIEGRYNITNSPFSLGVRTSYTHYHTRSNPYSIQYQSYNFSGTFDYNFRYWKKINLFAGIGTGLSIIDMFCYTNLPLIVQPTNGVKASNCPYGGLILPWNEYKMNFNPRVGAEFYNRIRVTTGFNFEEKKESYFYMTIGFVLGGRQK